MEVLSLWASVRLGTLQVVFEGLQRHLIKLIQSDVSVHTRVLGVLSAQDLSLNDIVKDMGSEHADEIGHFRVLEAGLPIVLAVSKAELWRQTHVIESQEEVAVIRNIMFIPAHWLFAVDHFDATSLPFLEDISLLFQFSIVFGQLMFLEEVLELSYVHLIFAIVRLLYFISDSEVATAEFFSAIPLQPSLVKYKLIVVLFVNFIDFVILSSNIPVLHSHLPSSEEDEMAGHLCIQGLIRR